MIEATEAEAQAALDRLKLLSLVTETSGGRTMRYAHNVGKALSIPPQSVAILAVLFLRGPQTAGELRINTERLHRFGDILAVEGFLRELAERSLVRELARAPGTRETRWMHLLSGEPAPAAAAAPGSTPAEAVSVGEIAAMKANIGELQREVAQLREAMEKLRAELGAT